MITIQNDINLEDKIAGDYKSVEHFAECVRDLNFIGKRGYSIALVQTDRGLLATKCEIGDLGDEDENGDIDYDNTKILKRVGGNRIVGVF